ncbi:MAG TPA: protein kinase, partial [Pseudonocardiaceae bacterium]|nr:protein kinase [Pseudonocardiaceae bacterium]
MKSALLHDAHGDRLSDPGAVERFVAEARVWVDLEPHPNICACHYVQVLRGAPRIFMEYVEGGSVADELRAGRMNTLAEMLGVGIQMAWGLAAIHDHNVVHQDVKPGNVLLAADGRVKITDLGLARARAATTSAFGVADAELVTRQGMTPPYASPEQWTGRRVGSATDVWSWAVSILELFTGQVTWSFGPAARDVLAHYLDQQPSVGRAGMPADVAALLGECLADDPGDRPTMDTVADRLVALYETHIGVYPHQAGGAAQRLAGEWNNKALSLLDLGDPVAAQECWKQALRVDPHHPGAMFNHGLTRWRSARITDQRLITDLENLLADLDERRLIRRPADFGETGGNVLHLLALVHLERGDAHSAVELLQEAVEFAADDPVVLAALTTATASAHRLREPRTLTGHTDWLNSVAVTPDGRRAVTGSSDHTARWWDLTTGRALHTLAGHTATVTSVAVTPDGGRVLTGSRDHDARWWDVATGQVLRTLAGDGPISAVAVTP